MIMSIAADPPRTVVSVELEFRRLRMKKFRAAGGAAAAVVAVLVCAGCSSGGASGTSGTRGTSAGGGTGGTATVLESTPPDSLDPQLGGTIQASQPDSLVYTPL